MTDINKSSDFGANGWNVFGHGLPITERATNPYDYNDQELFESPNGKFACLFYSINEYRMGAEAGLLAIFENKDNPILIANPKNQWFDYRSKNCVVFIDNYLFVRKLGYNADEKLSGTPFVVFDMEKKCFGFIDADWSSVFYKPARVSNTIIKFYPIDPDTLNHDRYNGEFDISKITYYPFSEQDNLIALYFAEKKALNK
jgi:hypothetical protein